jgi:hypothetical protein
VEAGETGRTTFTTRCKAYNGKAIHAESEIESSNIRNAIGKMQSIHFAKCVARYAGFILRDSPRSLIIAGEISPVVLPDVSRSSHVCLAGLRPSIGEI